MWTYALDLARGLKPHGVDTTLAVLGPRPAPDQRLAAAEAGAEVIETGLPLDWTAESVAEVEEAGRTLSSLAVRHTPDLIHLNSPALAASADYPAPVVGVCHSCVATWWEAVRGGSLPDDFRWRTDLVRQGYERAATLVAPSASFADATARLYGIDTPRVVWNGRRAASLPEPAAPEPLAFTAGRLWDDGKDLGTLDRAAARLVIPVEAAGPTEGPNGVRIALPHLRLLGRLDEAGIAARLARRPVFVSTALYEPFGLAVLEAARAGCALVLSDIPSFHELWNGAALFVPLRDDAGFAAAIESLLAHPGTRAALGEAARIRSERYTVEAMSAGMLAVYRALVPAWTQAA